MNGSATQYGYTFAVTSVLKWNPAFATAIASSHESVEEPMSSPHDLMVLAGSDPCGRILCPICREPFVAELGVSQLSRFMLADETEWRVQELIFCGHLCAWLARRERKPHA